MSEYRSPLKLGEVIDKITELVRADRDLAKANIRFDFCGLAPTGVFYCDRGWYERRSIQCSTEAHYPTQLDVQQFLTLLSAEVGKEREGWKGGNYTARRDTLVTVTLEADYSTGQMIVGVRRDCHGIILETQQEDLD